MGTFIASVRAVALLSLALSFVGCRTFDETEVRHLKETALVSAREHYDDGNYPECVQTLIAVAQVDADYAPMRELADLCIDRFTPAAVGAAVSTTDGTGEPTPAVYSPDHESAYLARSSARLEHILRGNDTDSDRSTGAFEPDLVGSNRANSVPMERDLVREIILFLPDRIIDLLDLVSFDVHFGPGVFAKTKVTGFLQAGGGGRGIGGFGWHHRRSFGVRGETESSFALLPYQAQAFFGATAGTSGVKIASASDVDFATPGQPLYQDYVDFWGVGASATIVYFGTEFEFHPVQLVDFLAGWVGIDFLDDDLSRHRPLRLDVHERRTIRELTRVAAQRK